MPAVPLASPSEKETNSSCLVHGLLDNFTFIWKNVSEHGFQTAFGEDWFAGGQFNCVEASKTLQRTTICAPL
ncbi:hypothetical protein Ocin01_14750 [Orchesella cincta]|uniref:Uncharacterized protein n=1 Tax=Orchesella cincta TaxID=48709 RepID=A0A1D2MG11_ORCCI|nr:hypothetical protein Ocin01_14750 [Orchesella cincta]